MEPEQQPPMIRIDDLSGDGDKTLADIAGSNDLGRLGTVSTPLRDLLEPLFAMVEPGPAPEKGARYGEFEVLEVLSQPGRPLCLRVTDPFYDGIETSELVLKEIPGTKPQERAQAILTQSQVAKAASPAIAEVLGFHVEAGRPFIVRRYVPGVSLERIYEILQVEEVPPDSPTWRLAAGARGGGANVTGAKVVCRIGQFAAQALADAHKVGAVHGALKPSNLICDDTVKPTVVDFGSRNPDPNCEAPEVISSTPRDSARNHLADLYSLGAILHEGLTRRPVFGEGSAQEIEQRALTQKPDKPTKHNFKATKEMSIISLALLEKEPSKRFANAGELFDDLDRYHRNEPIRRKGAGLMSRLFG